MTDLDRQIAELKGYSGFEIREGRFMYAHPMTNRLESGSDCLVVKPGRFLGNDWVAGQEFQAWAEPGQVLHIDDPGSLKVCIGTFWSGSDSKALELVDEISSLHFVLMRYEDPKDGPWTCAFGDRRKHNLIGFGRGSTRSEAICRAYIAAVTWMRGRG